MGSGVFPALLLITNSKLLVNYLFLKGKLIKLPLPAEHQQGGLLRGKEEVLIHFSEAGAANANLKLEMAFFFEA